MNLNLLGTDNLKTKKGEKFQYLTGILYLMPDDKLCPLSKAAQCRQPCLVYSGNAFFDNVMDARVRKTLLFYSDREFFMDQLVLDIMNLKLKAKKENMTLVIRLNGTSDIMWEKIKVGEHKNIFEMFPNVQFYDYTKIEKRIGNVPANYDLTFSYSGTEEYLPHVERALKKNARMSVVFKGKQLPAMFMGRPVINGDEHDLRFQEPQGVIVGLKFKRPTRMKVNVDNNPFVVKC